MSLGSRVKLLRRTSPLTPCTPATAPRQIRSSSLWAKTRLRSGRRLFGWLGFGGGGGHGFRFLLGRLGLCGGGRGGGRATGSGGGRSRFAFGLGRLELAALGAGHRLQGR